MVQADWLIQILPSPPVDIALYDRALTHGSTGKPDYQRLEFLGDRILGLVIAEMLYHRFFDEAEGRLSHRLNALVSGTTCAEMARQIDLPPRLRLGKQARDDGAQQSDNVLGDVMEALIGALYLEQGLEAARSFIMGLWEPLVDTANGAPKHPKSALQEWCA
ncbi:MAG: ribonuclease III domain-containing protein, partial [Sphingorhabdus sp.]